MDREEITQKIIEVSKRYGHNNPQQFKQLSFVFRKKYEREEVFYGIYNVFLKDEDFKYCQQELAGKLLVNVRPKVFLDLPKIIKDVLNTWDVSIEELPLYLKDLCGIDRVSTAIDIVSELDLNATEAKSLDTMKWWLGLKK